MIQEQESLLNRQVGNQNYENNKNSQNNSKQSNLQHLNSQVQNNFNKKNPKVSENQKWQSIIQSQQKNEYRNSQKKNQIPQLLTQQSFKSQDQLQQYTRQKKIMEDASKLGKQYLMSKQYISASKQLSKALMAFQFIMKNHGQSQIITKQQIKTLMIEIILPTYNNLALCYIKLKNFPLVLSFCNQILGQDPDNIKARYRRGIANKNLKNTQQARNDFQIVKKSDPQMILQCKLQIRQCIQIQAQQKRKRKLTAQRFLSGYQKSSQKAQDKTRADQVLNKQSMWQTKNPIGQHSCCQDDACDNNKTSSQVIKQNWIKWIISKCNDCSKIFQKLNIIKRKAQ